MPAAGPSSPAGRPHTHWREQRGRGRKRGLPVAERAGKSGLRGAGRRAEEAVCRTRRRGFQRERMEAGARRARSEGYSCLSRFLRLSSRDTSFFPAGGNGEAEGRERGPQGPVPGAALRACRVARKGACPQGGSAAAEGWPELNRCRRSTGFAARAFRALRDDAEENGPCCGKASFCAEGRRGEAGQGRNEGCSSGSRSLLSSRNPSFFLPEGTARRKAGSASASEEAGLAFGSRGEALSSRKYAGRRSRFGASPPGSLRRRRVWRGSWGRCIRRPYTRACCRRRLRR